MRAGPGLFAALLALIVLAASPAGHAAPATAEVRLAMPLDLAGDVSLAASEGLLALPPGASLPGTAARLNITLERLDEEVPDHPARASDPPPVTVDPVTGVVEQLRRHAAPARAEPVRYFDMLQPDRITFTSWQLDARRVLAVGPFDTGALALDGAALAVREAPAGRAGPLPPAFVPDGDASWLLAEGAGQARLAGSVRGLFEGVTIIVQNATASFQVDTVDRGHGAWRAVFRWSDADLAPAGDLALLAPRLGLDLDGTAASPGAWGSVAVAGEGQRAKGQSLLAQGTLQGTLAPGGGAVTMRSQGDLAYLTLGDTTQDYTAVAVVSGAAVAGALAWRFLALPLYARIAPNELLDNDVRRRVHGHVSAHPGADVKGTAQAVGVSWSTASYHLARLEREGVLTSRRAGRSKRFFLNGGTVTVRADAIGALRNPTAFAIAELIAQHPGLMQKEIGAALQLPASTVSWHMRRLRDLGVVREVRRWRRAEYAPGPLWEELARTVREDIARLPPARDAAPPGGAPRDTSSPSTAA